ncbi:putative 11-oxo-beta-amyrin 30-oxidase [Rosa chinensis]|uniref:Putative 11-oxo-beta-amyrin 30-oxidase n=1 Tax=Rosa chinensis TaxID=74649 RepID=A0A2P6Q8N4_ROSCH|nr:putative 11-oxo-beta-amyrin 30-oxidase [Rosa chinensis]
MGLQGIKGPSYKLVDGNAKEILNMKKEAMSRTKSLSHDIFPVVQPQYHSWLKTYGKIFLQWLGTEAQLVVMEPELCKEILNNKDKVYLQMKQQGFGKKLLGNSLATSEGEQWLKLRKLANHAFHRESLKSMVPDMIASTEKMVQRWQNSKGKEIEMYQEFKLFTSEVISRTAFGSSYLEGKKIFDMLTDLSSLLVKNSFKIRLPGIRITIDDIIDQCKALYFAGQETTNGLLVWTVFLLALHQDWQEEARKEVLQLFGKQNPNSDGISRLKTMNMIINESLRLYPPVIQLVKKAERESRLGKLIVPANIDLVIPNLALHHDPQIWGQDAELFKPERFSEGVAKATKDNMAAFIPFGMGPRICVGYNFATTETKIALSMILQRYALTLSPGYVHAPLHFLTVRPQHGVQVMLHSL